MDSSEYFIAFFGCKVTEKTRWLQIFFSYGPLFPPYGPFCCLFCQQIRWHVALLGIGAARGHDDATADTWRRSIRYVATSEKVCGDVAIKVS